MHTMSLDLGYLWLHTHFPVSSPGHHAPPPNCDQSRAPVPAKSSEFFKCTKKVPYNNQQNYFSQFEIFARVSGGGNGLVWVVANGGQRVGNAMFAWPEITWVLKLWVTEGAIYPAKMETLSTKVWNLWLDFAKM